MRLQICKYEPERKRVEEGERTEKERLREGERMAEERLYMQVHMSNTCAFLRG